MKDNTVILICFRCERELSKKGELKQFEFLITTNVFFFLSDVFSVCTDMYSELLLFSSFCMLYS